MPQRFWSFKSLPVMTISSFLSCPRAQVCMPRLERFSSAAFFAFHRLIAGLGLSVWRGLILSIARGTVAPFTGAAASASPSVSVQQGLRGPFTAKSSFTLAGITVGSTRTLILRIAPDRPYGRRLTWRWASSKKMLWQLFEYWRAIGQVFLTAQRKQVMRCATGLQFTA